MSIAGVDLWYVRSEGIDPSRLDPLLPLLTESEPARWARYRFESGRVQFLLGRVLARTALSQYASIGPSEWRFLIGEYGRLELDGPIGAPPLRFNLSHTPGLVVCAVAWDREVGADVEKRDRKVELRVADRYFAAAEVEQLRQLPSERQSATFLRFWTLKEAYIKARGLGLALPLGDFAFTLFDDQPPTIAFSSRIEDQPDQWRFIEFSAVEPYRIAVAVRASAPISVRCREMVLSVNGLTPRDSSPTPLTPR